MVKHLDINRATTWVVLAALCLIPSASVAMTASCTVSGARVTCDHIDGCNLLELVRALQNASASGSELSVRLEHSVVSDFPASLFEGARIAELDIHTSILEEFPHASFFGLSPDLRRLDLARSTVQTLRTDLNKGLPFRNSLTHLSFYQNSVADIGPFAFVDFPSLSFLDLSRNVIGALPDYAFAGLVHLGELQLAGNQIATVGLNAFPRMDALVTLNLGDNWIVTLPNGTFGDGNMPAIANVWLPYNVFTCDCQLQWLKDWLTAHGILEDSRGTCEVPTFATFSDLTFCAAPLRHPLLNGKSDVNQHHHNSILKIKEHVPLDG